MPNALTIDVEQHFPGHAFETAMVRAAWDRLHPWEVDPEQPPVASAAALSRLRPGVSFGRPEARLHRLLETRPFVPLREAFTAQLAS